ncbi:pyruvate-flavodoxin oxidoreductase, partial [gut metagenome]
YLGQKALRDKAIEDIETMMAYEKATDSFKAAAQAYLDTKNDGQANAAATEALIPELEKAAATGCPVTAQVLARK